MKRLYIGAALAVRQVPGGMQSSLGTMAALAVSQPEALGMMLTAWRERMLPADGWGNHDVRVDPVEDDLIRDAAAELGAT